MISAASWIGNALICVGLWNIGYKRRWALLFSIAGEACWIVSAAVAANWALAAICVVFCVMAARNWVLWGRE